jgi:hypothetical protein
MNIDDCRTCAQNADWKEGQNQALAQSQAYVARLSGKLLSAGKSNQKDRLQVAKLHELLSRQMVQVEHVSALAVDFEQGLKFEKENHLATQEELNCTRCKLEETAEEMANLRARVKISDDVLQALRETREVDVSDRFSLSSLIQEAVDKDFHDERMIQRHEWRERQMLLRRRSAALDARERALKSRATPLRGLGLSFTGAS